MGHCNSTHGGWGTDNGCGNYRNPAVHDRLMKSAEYFALMWERCDRQKVTIR